MRTSIAGFQCSRVTIARHSGRAFVASSVEAEGFWRESMRWPEFVRTEQQPVGNRIFVLDARGF